jgi:hypothetical protein
MTRDQQERTAVCAIARDETRYILQWAAYHLAIGFDRIHIYDNMSVRPIADMFADTALRSRVTVVRWPSVPGENAQLTAYRHFLHTNRETVTWAAVIDLDEFINLKIHGTIAGFLSALPAADAIVINWRMFGSSGHAKYRKQMLMERFQKASTVDYDANILVKTIHRMCKVEMIDTHNGRYGPDAVIVTAFGDRTDGGCHVPPTARNLDVAQINHYFVKSRDEWNLKNLRGYTDETVRAPDMFDIHDRNDILDTTILKHQRATLRMMRRIRRPANFIERLAALLP